MVTRFSKQAVADYISCRLRNIQSEHGFDAGNGTSQLSAITYLTFLVCAASEIWSPSKASAFESDIRVPVSMRDLGIPLVFFAQGLVLVWLAYQKWRGR